MGNFERGVEKKFQVKPIAGTKYKKLVKQAAGKLSAAKKLSNNSGQSS